MIADGASVSEAGNEAQRQYNEGSPVAYYLRSPGEIAGFFAGLELTEPGVVSCSRWRPARTALVDADEAAVFGGVARKP